MSAFLTNVAAMVGGEDCRPSQETRTRPLHVAPEASPKTASLLTLLPTFRTSLIHESCTSI
jgi:hypothetical protein